MKPKRDPAVTIPDVIRLPDGREVAIKDLTRRTTNRANHNLRTRRKTTIPTGPNKRTAAITKYSIQERVWQSTATVDAIMQRYGYTAKKALGVMYNSRYIVDRLGLDTQTKE